MNNSVEGVACKEVVGLYPPVDGLEGTAFEEALIECGFHPILDSDSCGFKGLFGEKHDWELADEFLNTFPLNSLRSQGLKALCCIARGDIKHPNDIDVEVDIQNRALVKMYELFEINISRNNRNPKADAELAFHLLERAYDGEAVAAFLREQEEEIQTLFGLHWSVRNIADRIILSLRNTRGLL